MQIALDHSQIGRFSVVLALLQQIVDGGLDLPDGGDGILLRHGLVSLGLIIHNLIQELILIADRDKSLGGVALAHADHGLALLPQTAHQTGEIAVRGHDAETVYRALVQDIHGVNHQHDIRSVFRRGVPGLLDGYNGVFQRLLVPAGQVRVGKVPVHPLIGDNAILFQLADNHVHIFGTGILSINQQCVFSFFHNNSHPSALVGFYTGLPCPPVFDIIILYPTFWEKASLSVVTLGTAVH